jgi:hypothetical protein
MSNALETTKQLNSPPSMSCDVTLGADFNVVAALGGFAATRLYVGTGGTVVGRFIGDPAGQFRTRKNVPNGAYLDGRWEIVRSTGNGTTAADIIAERY